MNFDSIVSVPTGGLVIASALAIETVKPSNLCKKQTKRLWNNKI